MINYEKEQINNKVNFNIQNLKDSLRVKSSAIMCFIFPLGCANAYKITFLSVWKCLIKSTSRSLACIKLCLQNNTTYFKGQGGQFTPPPKRQNLLEKNKAEKYDFPIIIIKSSLYPISNGFLRISLDGWQCNLVLKPNYKIKFGRLWSHNYQAQQS